MSRLVFTLHDLDQATAPRHMRQGSLTVSQNTRATKTGPRRKRRGFGRSAVSAYTFPVAADDTDVDPSATMQELSPGGALFRDASENIWARSNDGTTAYFRGEHRRCSVAVKDAGHAAHKTVKPVSIAVGTATWTFSLGTSDTSTSPTSEPSYNSFWLSVEDANGVVLRPPGYIADGTGNSVANYVPVYNPTNGKVYVFAVYRNTVVTVFNIHATTFAVSSQTTYRTMTAGKWNCVDAAHISTAAKVFVVATSWNEAAAGADNQAVVEHSFLNTATDVPSASVKAEDFDPGVTGAFLCSGCSILQGQPFTDGKIRYTYWVKSGIDQDTVSVVHVRTNDSTLSADAVTTVFSTAATRYTLEHAGVTSGFYTASSDISTIFAELIYPATADEETSNPTGLGNSFNAEVVRIRHNCGTLATTNQSGAAGGLRGSWLASKPFQGADSKWYVVTGADSGTDGYQRTFHVRRADIGVSRLNPDACRIVAQIFWPDASFRAHRWRANIGASPPTITNAWGWAPTVAAITGGCRVALGRSGETPQTHAIQIVTVDFGGTFCRGVPLYDDMILYPGGVPVVAGPRSAAHDLTPLMFPDQKPRLTAAGSSGALGAVLATTSFRFRDPSGRITRSTSYPTPASLVFNSAGTRTLKVRSSRHISHGTVEIELWATVPGGTSLQLQGVVPNDPTEYEVAINVDPANFRSDTETLPATAQGLLVPTPVPPCRLVATYGDRVMVSGTPTEGEFLFSQTAEAGFGPLFNIEGLVQTWIGQGAINAMAAVDLNTFAFFRAAQIGAVQGPGPADTGGAYGSILEINTAKGVSPSATRGGLVFQTPMGVVFQDAASARLCVLEPGLRVEEMPPGIEDTAQGAKLVAGSLMESEGTVWFGWSTGVITPIDLRHPDEGAASRWGNWHLWTSSALTASAPVGFAHDASGPLWLQANGSWRTYKSTGQLFQDTNATSAQVDVLQDLEMGLLAPDGHHGEVLVSDLQVLGTFLSASSVRFTTTNDASSGENHDATIGDPFNYSWRPGNLLRVQEFKLRITEQAGSTGEGFEVDSVGVEFQPAGRMKRLATGRII